MLTTHRSLYVTVHASLLVVNAGVILCDTSAEIMTRYYESFRLQARTDHWCVVHWANKHGDPTHTSHRPLHKKHVLPDNDKGPRCLGAGLSGHVRGVVPVCRHWYEI